MSRSAIARERAHSPMAVLLLAAYGVLLGWQAFIVAPGLHDNDWPLLMWLAMNASATDPSPLAVGHYGPLQLLLVRWLGPVSGSTLIAAKLLNIAAMLGLTALMYAALRHAGARVRDALLLTGVFALGQEALLGGQSEFGDPLAFVAFAAGVVLVLRARVEDRYRWLLAGLCLGFGGLVRLHLQMYALAALGMIGLDLLLRERGRVTPDLLAALSLLACGTLLAQLPLFALNWAVHGQLFSPVAATMVGQVLFPPNEFNLEKTYHLHPMAEILRDHKPALLRQVASRIVGYPAALLLPLGFALVGLRDARVRLCLALAALYYAAVVCLAWFMTPRLLLPFVWLLILASGIAIVTSVRWVRFAPIAALIMLAVKVGIDTPRIRDEVARSNEIRLQSTNLLDVLRRAGMTDPRSAFVLDWNRYVVDSPTLVGYYNTGFWNQLVPSFARERPNPWPAMDDPERFAAFLRANGARWVVLPRRVPIATLRALDEGAAPLPGYRIIARLPQETVWQLE